MHIGSRSSSDYSSALFQIKLLSHFNKRLMYLFICLRNGRHVQLFSSVFQISLLMSTVASVNTFHMADDDKNLTKCTKNVTKCTKKVNIPEFGDYIWNHSEKCIQISTNMPGIGLGIREILRFFRNKNDFVWMVKTMAAFKVLA